MPISIDVGSEAGPDEDRACQPDADLPGSTVVDHAPTAPPTMAVLSKTTATIAANGAQTLICAK
jgi:hypothetical protein